MLAASRALRPLGASQIIVAVPVAAEQTCDEFRKEVDQVVCLATPYPFRAVGLWYANFSQTSDDDVCKLLQEAGQQRMSGTAVL
jgi:putative phosphoribosyl transferase